MTESIQLTALFPSACSRLTSWGTLCCTLLVRSTHGLISALFPVHDKPAQYIAQYNSMCIPNRESLSRHPIVREELCRYNHESE